MAKYKCPNCGSTDIECKTWVKLNKLEQKTIKTDDLEQMENEDYWCCGCEEHITRVDEIE